MEEADGDGNYINAGYWSHCRRKFRDSIPARNKKCKAAYAVRLIDKAMELERMSIEEKYDEERLLELRREKVKPIIEEFYTFISSLSPGKRLASLRGGELCPKSEKGAYGVS